MTIQDKWLAIAREAMLRADVLPSEVKPNDRVFDQVGERLQMWAYDFIEHKVAVQHFPFRANSGTPLQRRIDQVNQELEQLRINNRHAKKTLIALHNRFDEFSKQHVMAEIRAVAEDVL